MGNQNVIKDLKIVNISLVSSLSTRISDARFQKSLDSSFDNNFMEIHNLILTSANWRLPELSITEFKVIFTKYKFFTLRSPNLIN